MELLTFLVSFVGGIALCMKGLHDLNNPKESEPILFLIPKSNTL